MEATASSSSWLETSSLSLDRKRVIEELIKGRESALQLRNQIPKSTKNDGSSSQVIFSQDLVADILSSFTHSLSILKNGDADEVSQFEAQTQLSSPRWEAYLKPEDSGESTKSSTVKDRRGRYKRRKCEESWTQNSSTLVDDGHAWRKYGQKVILKEKYQRNYFRCSHKFDQNCQATKQVQRINEEPPVYRTTYFAHHTCKNFLNASHQSIIESTGSDEDQSHMISFHDTTHITETDFNPFFTSIKHEKKDDLHQAPSCLTQTQNQSSSSSNDDHYLLSPEFLAFESNGGGGGPMKLFSSDQEEFDDFLDFDDYLISNC